MRTRVLVPFGFVVACFVLSGAAPTGAQPVSRCAECHFANMGDVPSPEYLGDWTRSAHSRRGVGCEKCHGGDAGTYDPAGAHRGVLNSEDPGSPVHPGNVPQTCGVCHRAIASAFDASPHRTAAAAASGPAPNCTGCHGPMRGRVPSPAALESRCAGCHPGGTSENAAAAVMRRSVENLDAAKLRCERLAYAVERVSPAADRLQLRLSIAQARYTLSEAVAHVHAFSAPTVDERTEAARRTLDAIADALSVAR